MSDPERPDVTVLTTGHDLADSRLHRLVRPLLARGLTVEVRGLGAAADGPAGDGVVSVDAAPRRGMLNRAARSLVRPAQARGRVLVVLDPDLVPTSMLMRTLGRGPVVVDVSEDYAALLEDRSWAQGLAGRAARGLVGVATRLAATADLTVSADEHVPPLAARSRLVLRNLPTTDYVPEPTEPELMPRALYVGDVRRSRGLRTMLEAVEQASPWTLDVVGQVAEADRAWLERWQSTSPAADRVRFHGRRPPGDSWQLARGAWVGLSLLERTPAFEAAMPSKVYEYLSAGLPVLSTPLPRARILLEETGAGRIVADADETATCLRSIGSDVSLLASLRGAAAAARLAHLAGTSAYDDFADRVAALVDRRTVGRR